MMRLKHGLFAAVLAALAGEAGIAYADDALALAQKHACTACHAIDKKLVGPAYKEVAAKYKGNKDAETLLAKKVLDGGSGVWGTIPMPPHKGKLKDDEIKTLVKWVLAQ
jgi:cytochrome c